MDLFANAIVAGVLLGAFYAAVAVGLAITFGQLDIVNIAHPAFVIVGSYIAWILNSRYGLDPVLVGVLVSPIFFLVGVAIYRIYYLAFERTGQESLSGLAFFFGVMFIIEVLLILVYGVDYRLVSTPYLADNWDIGYIGIPLRLAVPFLLPRCFGVGVFWPMLCRADEGRRFRLARSGLCHHRARFIAGRFLFGGSGHLFDEVLNFAYLPMKQKLAVFLMLNL